MSMHNGGRQMGINPCPLSLFYRECAATKNSEQKMGQGLQKPIGVELTQSQKGVTTTW